MMTLACAAIGPNGERCARAAGHPGQHVPAPKTSVSPIQPPALVAAASGATAAVPPGVTPVEPAAPAKPGKRGQPSKTTTSAVDADADADAEAESDGGSWTVPPEPLVRTDQAILGMLLLALLYGVGSGVITLIARSAAASDAAAAAAHVKGATVSGRGAATSSSFSLEGDYLVRWTATPSTANGCYHAAVLERGGRRPRGRSARERGHLRQRGPDRHGPGGRSRPHGVPRPRELRLRVELRVRGSVTRG